MSQRNNLTVALAALSLGGFAIGTTEFVAMGLLPEIAHGVGVSVPAGGHVVSAYALGVVVGAPVLAGVGARFSRRSLLIALMAAYTIGNLLSAVSPSYSLLVAALSSPGSRTARTSASRPCWRPNSPDRSGGHAPWRECCSG